MKEPHLALASTVVSPTEKKQAQDCIWPKAALPIIQCRDVSHRPTPEATAGAAGLKVYSEGGTHISPFLLYLQPLLQKCLCLIIQRVPLPSPRWKTHLSFISSRSDSHLAFTKPGLTNSQRKKLFSHQPDKCSHQTELGEQAQGVVTSPSSPLTWGVRNSESDTMETLVFGIEANNISTTLAFRFISIVFIVVVFPSWLQCESSVRRILFSALVLWCAAFHPLDVS